MDKQNSDKPKVKSESMRREPAKSDLDIGLDGLTMADVDESTAVVIARRVYDGTQSVPIVPPICHTSTYILEKTDDMMKATAEGGSVYSRLSNDTCEALEASINVLERGYGSLTFASGMAAVTTVHYTFLEKGDHVILQCPGYSGTLTNLKHMSAHYGIELTMVSAHLIGDPIPYIKDNTKLIWLESPSNPCMHVVDIRAISKIAKERNILVAVDGTFGSPCGQKLIQLGADFAVQSCTKYMGGHSDLIAGCVTVNNNRHWRMMKHMQGTLGNMLSPHDASLLLRSLKTLPMRFARHSDNALKVAAYLDQHPKIERVSFPGLPSHPQHQVAASQMTAYGGMIMAVVKGGGPAGKKLSESTKIFRLAVSLGGVESILEHPYSMTHGPYLLTQQEIDESGILPGLLRISVGIEDPDDLINDFKQALEKVTI